MCLPDDVYNVIYNKALDDVLGSIHAPTTKALIETIEKIKGMKKK